MLNNIYIGRYYPVNSIIHKLNPITKLLALIIYLVMIFLNNNLMFISILGILLIIVFEISRLPRSIYLKTLLSLKYILLFIVIIYLLSKYNNIDMLVACLRLYLIVLCSTIFTLTTTPNDITYAIEKVLYPLNYIKIPVNRLAFSLSLALRFIPTIIDQGNKILKSQASRGVDYKQSKIKDKFFSLKSILVPMFILTMRRSDELAEAMEVRMYDVDEERTSLKKHGFSFNDICFILIHIGLLVLEIVVIK